MTYAWLVETDDDNNIYISDDGQHKIHKFDQNGNYIKSWNTGYKPEEMLVIDNKIYTAVYNYSIEIYDLDGNFIERWSLASRYVQYIRTDGEYIYVTGWNPGRNYKFSLDGELQSGYPKNREPYLDLGFAISSNDHEMYFYNISKRQLRIFDMDYNFIRSYGYDVNSNGALSDPTYIAASEKYYYIISSTENRIDKIDKITGNSINRFGSLGSGDGQFSYPRFVSLDSNENVYILDTQNDRVVVYDSSGNFLKNIGVFDDTSKNLTIPSGMYIYNDIIYVTDLSKDNVRVYNVDGELVNTFGESGTTIGKLDYPKEIFVNAEEIIVYEVNRISFLKFSLSGEFISETSVLPTGTVRGVCMHANNYIVSTLSDGIQKFDLNGNFIGRIVNNYPGYSFTEIKYFGNCFVIGDDLYLTSYTNMGFHDIVKYSFDRTSPNLDIKTHNGNIFSTNVIQIDGIYNDLLTNITSIEYQFENEEWEACGAKDGVYDSLSEGFECDLSSHINHDGEYRVKIRATDSMTNTSKSDEIRFIYDTTPPESLKYNGYDSGINLYTGLNVTTNPYKIDLNAKDNLSGVSKVEFFIDGDLVCTDEEVNDEGLYECDWDTEKYHIDILVRMYDMAGNVGEFEVLGVNVRLEDTGINLMMIPFILATFVIIANYECRINKCNKKFIN